ncbi:unnamed protein product [Strongylus vulgaris]|uniref:RRM domain-containing protein n=1 Tax=Strongylus vulgaris TaxID=40348 RepID=A0A3P7JCC0_STRVU|nr:unnamed protein product [Strongylus vulgaris]
MGADDKRVRIKVLQVSNISVTATKDQIFTMFQYVGRIEEMKINSSSQSVMDFVTNEYKTIGLWASDNLSGYRFSHVGPRTHIRRSGFKVYPSDMNITSSTVSKCAFIKYDDERAVEVGQHLTNTVLIDRAIVCAPFLQNTIPDEATFINSGGPVTAGQRQLPPHVSNKIQELEDGTSVYMLDRSPCMVEIENAICPVEDSRPLPCDSSFGLSPMTSSACCSAQDFPNIKRKTYFLSIITHGYGFLRAIQPLKTIKTPELITLKKEDSETLRHFMAFSEGAIFNTMNCTSFHRRKRERSLKKYTLDCGYICYLLTVDPQMEALGLPAYPPLPGNTDLAKVEEIRRTIYVGNLPKGVDGQAVLDFFNNFVGEVMYLRMATGPDTLPCAYAYVEFTNQTSVPIALQNNGIDYEGKPLRYVFQSHFLMSFVLSGMVHPVHIYFN